MNPRNRYDPLVPDRFAFHLHAAAVHRADQGLHEDGPESLASTGASCAYTIAADGTLSGESCRRWSANDKLVSRVSAGMASACPALAAAGAAGERVQLRRLWNGATDSNVGSLGGVAIRRRIFTTSQNGVFGPTVDQLMQGRAHTGSSLWPPQTASIAYPWLRRAIPRRASSTRSWGSPWTPSRALRPRSPTCGPSSRPAWARTCPPAAPAMTVTSGFTLAQMQRARREAREMILAFLAGAQFKADATTGLPKRATATSSFYTVGDVLYIPRTQILAESTLATPAVVSPPQEETPDATLWKPEYELYRDGPRTHTNPSKEPDGVNPVARRSFVLASPCATPDRDGNNTVGRHRPGTGLLRRRLAPRPQAGHERPVRRHELGAARVPGRAQPHDHRHHRVHERALGDGDAEARSCGRSCRTTSSASSPALPQQPAEARPARLHDRPRHPLLRHLRAEPGHRCDPSTTPVAKTAGGISLGDIQGVWRKVLFVGRGKGGKYMTAIDVTAPGPVHRARRPRQDTPVGPIILWSRGNPDTSNGAVQGQAGAAINNNQDDYDAYLKMGETWSVPAFAYIGRDMARADNPTRKVTATPASQRDGLRPLRGLRLRRGRRGDDVLQHRPAHRATSSRASTWRRPSPAILPTLKRSAMAYATRSSPTPSCSTPRASSTRRAACRRRTWRPRPADARLRRATSTAGSGSS